MSLKLQILVGAALLIAGFYIGSQYCSKTEVETVEKEIVKNNIITRTIVVENKDGSKTTETVVIDKSKQKKSLESSVTIAQPPKYNLISVSAHSQSFKEPQYYTVTYQRRLLGNIWTGASYNTKNEFGLSVALEF